MSGPPSFDVVVPTIGRPSLATLLQALADARGPLPRQVTVVDDRPGATVALEGVTAPRLADRVKVLRGPAAGPAAARNVGWRASEAEWVAFLDDDVVVDDDWLHQLAADLEGLAADVVGSQGRIRVPRPLGRRPTDWERNVAGLETARWATADLAYRRAALAAVGGFDERFPRAYREDADLGLRLVGRGWRIVQGRRGTTHPVRPADCWVSVRLQAGNADDALMRALHGRGWRARAGVPVGGRPRHLAVTAAGVVGLAGLLGRRRRMAVVGLGGWLAGTAELAWSRIAPGPRDLEEAATMLRTSAVLPAAATGHWLAGWWRVSSQTVRAGRPRALDPPAAVLLDRDGTLVQDVPYNGDPARVRPMPGAREALDRLRAAGVPTAVVSNQSGVGRGLLTMDQVGAVNARCEELLGPLGPWLVCPHTPTDGCGCRKPSPALVLSAAETLGVDPARCALIGDIGADVQAARAAGARAVLVPTARTLRRELVGAPEVAPDLPAAVDLLLAGRPTTARGAGPGGAVLAALRGARSDGRCP